MKSNLLIFVFYSLLVFLVSYPRNHCQIQCNEAFSLCFSSSFSSHVQIFFMHCELIFLYMVLGKGSTSFCCINIWFSQFHLLKRLSHIIILTPLSMSSDHIYEGLFLGLLFHYCACLSLFQYHTFDYVALQQILKSGNASPPTLFFFFQIFLAFRGLLKCHINFRADFLFQQKKKQSYWGILIGIAMNLRSLWVVLSS